MYLLNVCLTLRSQVTIFLLGYMLSVQSSDVADSIAGNP
jgi:hypothetical protein